MELQEVPQNDGLAQDASSTQDPNTLAGSNQATAVSQSSIDPNTHTKLKTDYQATLGRLRQTQGELNKYMGEMEQYKAREAELNERLKRLESAGQMSQQSSREPDFSTMSQEQIIQYLTEQSSTKAAEAAYQRMQKEQQAKEAALEEKRMTETRAQEEERFQKRWDELFSEDPEANVDEIEKFMRENRVFDPVWAYNLMNKDFLTQKAVAQAEQKTVQKIASNKKSFTEGSGKAGVTPPPKPDFGSSKSRKGFIQERMSELMNQNQPNY